MYSGKEIYSELWVFSGLMAYLVYGYTLECGYILGAGYTLVCAGILGREYTLGCGYSLGGGDILG